MYTHSWVNQIFFLITFYFFQSDQSTLLVFRYCEGVVQHWPSLRPVLDDSDVMAVNERNLLMWRLAVWFDGRLKGAEVEGLGGDSVGSEDDGGADEGHAHGYR